MKERSPIDRILYEPVVTHIHTEAPTLDNKQFRAIEYMQIIDSQCMELPPQLINNLCMAAGTSPQILSIRDNPIYEEEGGIFQFQNVEAPTRDLSRKNIYKIQ